MAVSKTSKMLNFINYRMRVTIQDSRQMVGTFMAFDKHMNLVLGDCEEFRRIKGKKGGSERIEKRTLGLVLLRGETIVSMQIEAPPSQKQQRGVAGLGGPGIAKSAGRGMPSVIALGSAPQGLGGPIRGVGGAQGPMMQPPMIAQPPIISQPPRPQPGLGRGVMPMIPPMVPPIVPNIPQPMGTIPIQPTFPPRPPTQ